MTAIATTIEKENSCPDIVVNNTTTYPENSTHSVTNFTEYVKYSLLLPNGFLITFTSGYPNQILPPAEKLSVTYQTCLTGKFTATYIALPTPPDEIVGGQGNEYGAGDNFYYAGVIYQVNIDNFVSIPTNGFTNAELIVGYLSTNSIQVISEDEIASKYKSEIDFTNWCTVDTCLLDKLSKINCLIVAEPTRNDLCEMTLYEQVEQLNFIKNIVDNVLSNPYVSTPEEDYNIESMSNYVNSICCCKDKKCS